MKTALRIGIVAALALAALALGQWVGYVTAPRDIASILPGAVGSRLANASRNAANGQGAQQPYADAFYFMGPMTSAGNTQVVAEEIAMAAGAGVHRHMVWAPLPWDPAWDGLEELLQDYTAADPDGVFVLNLDLNPPASWLAARPDETASTVVNGLTYPSIGSAEWIGALEEQLAQLAEGLSETDLSRKVVGATLAALEDGQWYRSDGYDRSKAATTAYRAWLKAHYKSAEALQKAWGKPGLAFEQVVPPSRPVNPGQQPLLFSTTSERDQADFLSFLCEQTAAVIGRLADLGKELGGERFEVYVPYGFTLELANGDAGHFALKTLRESAITGFLAPISYQQRGIGGVGGPQGLLDVFANWPQRWLLIDDTRTGIVHTGGEGGPVRPLGLKLDDVLSVFRRNFGMALLHDAKLAWADPSGEGNLHDPGLWEEFGQLIEMANGLPVSVSGENDAPEPVLTVAISEESFAWTRPGGTLNESLVRDLRDTVLKSGIPSRFVLLRDVVSGAVPPTRLYLIPNAFTLTAASREALHKRFTQERAGVIWLYAPGYAADGDGLTAIRDATRMNVMTSPAPQASGSTLQIGGDWMNPGTTFSTGLRLDPAFYIEDEDADTLTVYVGTEQVSGAMRFLDEGWTSVYLAEPTIPVGLLREVANVLDVPVLFRKTQLAGDDLVDLRKGLLLIHSAHEGDRLINLGVPHRVDGLLHPSLGWPNNALINIVLNAGDTYLFRVKQLDYVPALPPETTIEELPPTDGGAMDSTDPDYTPEEGESESNP